MWLIGLLFYSFQMIYSRDYSKRDVSKERQKLEEDIENARQELEICKHNVNPQKNESIRILSEKKSKKEEELKNCYWFQCMTFIKYLLKVNKNVNSIL